MKLFVISDNVDTQTAMRLAGAEGVVVHEQEEFEEAIKEALNDKEIGVLLITEKLAKDFPEMVSELKVSVSLPLVVEIPDRHGTGRAPDSITSYVKDAIGVKI